MVEEVDVPRQRVLVHRLDVAQLADVEEEMRDVHGEGPVSLAGLVNRNLSLLCDGLLAVDLVGELLGVCDDVDRRLRLEDATLG